MQTILLVTLMFAACGACTTTVAAEPAHPTFKEALVNYSAPTLCNKAQDCGKLKMGQSAQDCVDSTVEAFKSSWDTTDPCTNAQLSSCAAAYAKLPCNADGSIPTADDACSKCGF